MTKLELILATQNKGKAREFQHILSEFLPGLTLLELGSFGIAGPLLESGKTLEENAIQKAIWVFEQTGKPSLSDDSGLEVDALGGSPGVYSARFAGEKSTSEENNQKLMDCLRGITNRKARFRTVLCLAGPFGCKTWNGTLDGKIGTELKGSFGFGYDPLFIPDGEDRSFAELSEEEKNRISHRRLALEKLAQHLIEGIR